MSLFDFLQHYFSKTIILIISENMVFIVVRILLQKRKIMFFEIIKIKLFLQYFFKTKAVENQNSSLLYNFLRFFQI